MRFYTCWGTLPKAETLPVQVSTITVCPTEIVHKAYEEYAAQGHGGQSLARLCERGGFSWAEIASLLMDGIQRERIKAHADFVSAAKIREGLNVAAAWQPMTTAPKDGTEIILRVQRPIGRRCFVGHWMPGGHCIEDHPAIDAGWYFWNGCMFDTGMKPLDWKALPQD